MNSTILLRWGILLCAVVHLGSARASAGLVFYTSEAAFDAASPALATQTFASANIPAAGYATIGNPLNSSTNNSVFSAGSILPGMTMTSSAEHAGQDLTVVAPGLFGNTNKAIYNDYGGDSLATSFSSPETAVGMGLLNPNGTSINFIVDSMSGSQLGSQVVTVNSAGPAVFFGVIATGGDQIGMIKLLGQASNGKAAQDFAGMDRLVFGASPSAVPEPGSLALMGLGAACLLSLGVIRRRARSLGRKRVARSTSA